MKIGIYGGSFNPPCIHHIQIAEHLKNIFDIVVVVPCGKRPDKESANVISMEHKKDLVKIAFSGLDSIIVDYHDLENGVYTPTYYLQKRYENIYPDAEIWHCIGTDLVVGGRESELRKVWDYGREIWNSFNWLLMYRPKFEINESDMPPCSKMIKISDAVTSATVVRDRIKKDEKISDLVIPEVEEYIKKTNIYKQENEPGSFSGSFIKL